MKNVLGTLILATVLLFAVSAMAQTKVVVIPLMKSDPNIQPENICLGITIVGVAGTKICSHDTYSTVTSAGGQVWMDRNLGASQVATSSTDSAAYGDLYQWGRLSDGHQSRTSHTDTTLSSSDVPGHGSFILAPGDPYDWRSGQNNNLWQGVNGTNNPCPSGFRLPTETEWQTEIDSWGDSPTAADAFASPLKLVMAGYLSYTSGVPFAVGTQGSYWSSALNGINGRYLLSHSTNAYMYGHPRAYGFSVRCLKD